MGTSLNTENPGSSLFKDLDHEISNAIRWYWETREGQAEDQKVSKNSTRGRRADVLGGNQMDGFSGLVEDILTENGVPKDAIVHDYHATLPGYFRHEKEWDTAIVHDGELLAAVEFKSQASSFGNNLNNRAEEAVGSNTDLLEAYEEGVFEPSPPPWLGYLMLMADNEESRKMPGLREPNFPADDEFQGATYVDRMELLCLRMLRKRLVNGAAFILSDRDGGLNGEYEEPNEELRFERFVRALTAHVTGYID